MTARELIEEARERVNQTRCSLTGGGVGDSNALQAINMLDEALSLLPDAGEPASRWQEFDPNREETWPKENDGREWIVEVEICVGEPEVSTDWWVGKWNGYSPNVVKRYQPLPLPYVKP